MSRSHIYARNLVASWLGLVIQLVVMFLLTPFVVGSLGDVGYGVWSLVTSLTGYLGLVELGIGTSLGRFINFYLARDDVARVNGIISTAAASFVALGAAVLGVAGVIAALFGVLFAKVPDAMVPGARMAVLLVAGALWLEMFNAIFISVLRSFESFHLWKAASVAAILLRAGATVLVLRAGWGFVGLALVLVGIQAIHAPVTYLLARHVFPALRIRRSLVGRGHFRELWGFSIWAFLGNVAHKLLYLTDIVVITILLGPRMVTFYTIPQVLVGTARGVLHHVTSVLAPQTIRASSVGDYRELRWLFIWGSKAIMVLGLPMLLGLIFLGRQFLTLWLDIWTLDEIRMSSIVLVLMAAPQFVVLATRQVGSILSGLGRVRFAATFTLIQAVTNLGLTLLFVMVFGLRLYGVALGTLVPMVIFNIVLTAVVLRWIRMPAREYLLQSVARWMIAAGVVGAMAYGVLMLPGAESWSTFILKAAAVGIAGLFLCWMITLTPAERANLRERFGQLLGRKPAADES